MPVFTRMRANVLLPPKPAFPPKTSTKQLFPFCEDCIPQCASYHKQVLSQKINCSALARLKARGSCSAGWLRARHNELGHAAAAAAAAAGTSLCRRRRPTRTAAIPHGAGAHRSPRRLLLIMRIVKPTVGFWSLLRLGWCQPNYCCSVNAMAAAGMVPVLLKLRGTASPR